MAEKIGIKQNHNVLIVLYKNVPQL
jgi:hypothetical protein